MRERSAVTVAAILAVCAPLAWAFGNTSPGVTPTPAVSRPDAPELALLEGPADGDGSLVVLRRGGRSRALGRVPHAVGGARQGVVVRGGEHPLVAVVAQQRPSTRASTYDSALFFVDEGGARQALDGVTNASRPLVTRGGLVLVQRGSDGDPIELVDRQLRERRDPLRIDAVDPSTGASRTVWEGAGQIAFLACALDGDEALVLHLDDQRATLRVLDAARGVTRVLREGLHLARDFSYDAARGEVLFAQAEGPSAWAVRAISLRDSEISTKWQGESDHLMPFALGDGRVALSLPGDHGLGVIPAGGGAPGRVAPLGEGSDAALARYGDWIALRHTDSAREAPALVHLPTGAGEALAGGDGEVRVVLGFTEAR
ncbi:MAG: hypothetical protein R3A48_03880 [Polyangiales bacterium]